MIQISPQFLLDLLSRAKAHVEAHVEADRTQYPDEINFLDAGKVGGAGLVEEEHDSKCIAYAKQDYSEEWTTYDEILSLVEWVAAGKYNPVPAPSGESRPEHVRYYRRQELATDAISPQGGLPAQLRVPTPETYRSEHPRSFIYVRIDWKVPGETRWTTDSKYGLNDVLEMLESGSYRVGPVDLDKREGVFHRLY